jgi:glucokinase
MTAFVFDLGGTSLRCGVVRGGQLAEIETILVGTIVADAPDAWDRILDHICAYCARVGPPTTDSLVVWAVPGPVRDGLLVQAPTVRGAPGRPVALSVMLERRLGCRIALLNDVSAAAWWALESSRVERFMVVTVSSGIGSKVVVPGLAAPVIDVPLYAGEIGHVRVDFRDDAPVCDCGRIGHLGAIASGRGIERSARERALAEPAAFAHSLCAQWMRGDANALTNEAHVVPAVRADDAWATAVVVECTRPLGQLLGAVVMALGLRRIVVIGGFAHSLGARYQAILGRALAEATNYEVFAETNVIEVANEEFPCLRGASAFASHLQS